MSSAILTGWVTLRLNFTLKVTCGANLYGLLDMGMYTTTLPLQVFTKKLCSRLYSIKVEFYFLKTKKWLSEPPFGELRGNVRTLPIARWIARGRLPIRHN